MMEDYLVAKALHVVGFVSWFAGLFYVVRLFIYHAEAGERPPEQRDVLRAQYAIMQSRLWSIITVPAMVVTVGGGLFMVFRLGALAPWLHVKLTLVALLLGYHVQCGRIRKQQAAGTCTWQGGRLRIWNEVATLLLVAIVFLAVFQRAMSAVWGVVGLLALAAVLMIGIRIYRRSLAGQSATSPKPDATPSASPPAGQ